MRIDLHDCFRRAYTLRQPLLASGSTNACQLFNGAADGIDGLVVEQLGDVLIVQIHEGRFRGDIEQLRQAIERLHGELGSRAVYRKTFVRDRSGVPVEVQHGHHDATPWIGEAVEPEQTVTENGLQFIIRPFDGFSIGLFLEHRDNRRRVREQAAGKRVLNTFAYTCSFSVAAVAGGATSVASVDLSKRYLEWGKRNFAANGLGIDRHWFFCCDVIEFYKRAARQGRRYDLIILDPPTFSRTLKPRRTFVLAEQLCPLIAGAMGLLDPGGLILLSTNDRELSLARMEEELSAAARSGHRRCTIAERPALPVDFADDPAYSKALIARID